MTRRDFGWAGAGAALVIVGAVLAVGTLHFIGRLDRPDPAATAPAAPDQTLVLHAANDPEGFITKNLVFVADGPLARGGPVWVDDKGRTQVWAGWHDKLPNGTSHHGFEVKTSTDPNGATPDVLATRFRLKSDEDQTKASFFSTSMVSIENGAATGEPFGIEFQTPSTGSVLDGTARDSRKVGQLVVSSTSDGLATMDISPGVENTSGSVVRFFHDSLDQGPRQLSILKSDGTDAWTFDAKSGATYFSNAAAIPDVNPSNGGYLFVQDGALMWRGSSGTVTRVAAS